MMAAYIALRRELEHQAAQGDRTALRNHQGRQADAALQRAEADAWARRTA